MCRMSTFPSGSFRWLLRPTSSVEIVHGLAGNGPAIRPRNAGVRSSSIERMSAQAGFFPLFWRADPERVPNTSRPLSKSAAAMASHPSVTGSPGKISDRALLGRVATGDVAALRLIYEAHAPRAMAIARRILRNVEEAEDIVQETFLELWRRAPQFDGRRGGLFAWVVTIARSRAIDRLRAAGTAGRAIEGVATAVDAHPTLPPCPDEHT